MVDGTHVVSQTLFIVPHLTSGRCPCILHPFVKRLSLFAKLMQEFLRTFRYEKVTRHAEPGGGGAGAGSLTLPVLYVSKGQRHAKTCSQILR